MIILLAAVYINHRPAFGLSPEKIKWAFDTLGLPTEEGNAIERGDLLDMLQSKGRFNSVTDVVAVWIEGLRPVDPVKEEERKD